MIWVVTSTKRVKKQVKKLPQRVKAALYILVTEIKELGPVRGNWPNYSSLGSGQHHCHLKKGHPTYVAVWKVIDKEIQIVEIQYAGTYEKTPY
ncbi:MAG: cytotoxic translational repressor of toxin-antitoxin stability system [Desulfobacteraceae bacterium 4572_19]|nr:MAG: cytotoxic translational repressor of toxin-antitoxin stability system [Desulfobacteraceae bacterium 4572_19]